MIPEVIVPWAQRNKQKRRVEGSKVPDDIIVILDCWPVQATEHFRDTVKRKFPNVKLLYLPPNMTGLIQPRDVAINSCFKQQVKQVYGVYASKQEDFSFLSGANKARKALLIDWVYHGWNNVLEDVVHHGWNKAGLLDAWENDHIFEMATEEVLSGTLFPKRKNGKGCDPEAIPEGHDAALGQCHNHDDDDDEFKENFDEAIDVPFEDLVAKEDFEDDDYETMTEEEDDDSISISLMDTDDDENENDKSCESFACSLPEEGPSSTR